MNPIQKPKNSLAALLACAAVFSVLVFSPSLSQAVVREGDKPGQTRVVKTVPVYIIRNFAGDGQKLGEWFTHREPTLNGACVSWTQDAGNERMTVCGGTTHIVRKEEALLQIQKPVGAAVELRR